MPKNNFLPLQKLQIFFIKSFYSFILILCFSSTVFAEINKPSQIFFIKSKENLSHFLYRVGVKNPHTDALQIDRQTKKRIRYLLKPQRKVRVDVNSEGRLSRLRFSKNYATDIEIIRQKNKWILKETKKELHTRVSFHESEITKKNNSIYRAIKSDSQKNIGDEIIDQIAEILGWKINFNSDVRVGDKIKFFYEEIFYKNQKVREGSILAVKYIKNSSSKKPITAVMFRISGKKRYFNLKGESIEKYFLRYPLKFSRISSRFRKRFHPILKRWRAHKGIDFAARRGTPVFSVGDGRVIQRIRHKAYGKVITINHNSYVKTKYAHLNSFSRKLRRGSFVSKGQIIGYVGSTGLSTGPHLHYEWIQGGRSVNPFKVRIPNASSIPKLLKPQFDCQFQNWKYFLDSSLSGLFFITEPYFSC